MNFEKQLAEIDRKIQQLKLDGDRLLDLFKYLQEYRGELNVLLESWRQKIEKEQFRFDYLGFLKYDSCDEYKPKFKTVGSGAPKYALFIYPSTDAQRDPHDYGRATLKMESPETKKWDIDQYLSNDRVCKPLYYASDKLEDLDYAQGSVLRKLVNWEIREYVGGKYVSLVQK